MVGKTQTRKKRLNIKKDRYVKIKGIIKRLRIKR